MKQNHPIFRGIATALITPTTPTGIDYDRVGRLIDWQIQQGINALVICGTTGESSTLTDAEHRRAIAFACERVNGRVPVIAGTGSNETDYAVELTKSACADGADAVLVVTPYYNKTTQRGLVTMYNTIADASTKPVILYNVPSRTGIGIEPATYVKLAEHPNIAAIKEANSDISKIVETFSLVGDRLDIYSGNDDQIVPILSMGGAGCISVLSNVIPAETVAITQRFFAGDVAGAAQLQCRYMPLIRALFPWRKTTIRGCSSGCGSWGSRFERGGDHGHHCKRRPRPHGPGGLPPAAGGRTPAGRRGGPFRPGRLLCPSGRLHRARRRGD